MHAKKEYYKKFVDRRVRGRKLVYLVILFCIFGVVLYDSFLNHLPFYYVLFFFVGRIFSLLFGKTQPAENKGPDQKITIERNMVEWVFILLVVLFRKVLFPEILSEFNVIFVSDAAFLFMMGWFSGRLHELSQKIEAIAFVKFMQDDST